jgi:ferritin-like metal-binding protein YciE
MAKEPKKLEDLFHDTLKDIYYAEKKILTALPKMAKAAQNEQLTAAFEKHEGETEGQIARLEKVFAEIDEKPQGKKCAAIEGILDEGKEIMGEYKGSPALDAGLVSAAQAVEHYEICRYGTLRTWAEELGLANSVKLLQATLAEEEATDKTLTQLAEAVANQDAQPGAA